MCVLGIGALWLFSLALRKSRVDRLVEYGDGLGWETPRGQSGNCAVLRRHRLISSVCCQGFPERRR